MTRRLLRVARSENIPKNLMAALGLVVLVFCLLDVARVIASTSLLRIVLVALSLQTLLGVWRFYASVSTRRRTRRERL